MNSNQSEILNYPIYTRENYYTQYEYDEDQKRRLYLAIQKKNITAVYFKMGHSIFNSK